MLAFLRREAERELPERIAASVLAKSCSLPALTTIDGISDFANTLAAIERYAAHGQRASRSDFRAVLHGRDERAHVEPPDGASRCRRRAGRNARAFVVGNAVSGLHPESIEHIVEHFDLRNVLDP